MLGSLVRLVPIALLSAALACDSGPAEHQAPAPTPAAAEPAGPKPAPKAEFELVVVQARLKFLDEPSLPSDSAYIQFGLAQGKLAVSTRKIPAGTKIDVAGQSWSVPEGAGPQSHDFDVDDRLADVKASVMARDAGHGASVELDIGSVHVELPGYAPVEGLEIPGKARKTFQMQLAQSLARIAEKPRPFAGADTNGPPDAAVLVWGNDSTMPSSLIGAPELLRDVDWIALGTLEDSGKTKSCSGYVGGGSESVEVRLLDGKVKIVDLRSGETVAEQQFKAQTSCPKTVFAEPGKATSVNTPKLEPIEAWVAKQLRAAK